MAGRISKREKIGLFLLSAFATLLLIACAKAWKIEDVREVFYQVKSEYDQNGIVPDEIFLLTLKNEASPESTALYEVLVHSDQQSLLFLEDRFRKKSNLRDYLRGVFSKGLEVIYEGSDSFRREFSESTSGGSQLDKRF